MVVLKVLPQHSHRPMVSSVLFPALSGLPAIFQVFFGVTSFPHLGHFAISNSSSRDMRDGGVLTPFVHEFSSSDRDPLAGLFFQKG